MLNIHIILAYNCVRKQASNQQPNIPMLSITILVNEIIMLATT
jgi:hypothetical protein